MGDQQDTYPKAVPTGPVPEEKTEKPPRRKPKPFWIIGALAVIVGLGWLVLHILNAGKESTDDAQIQADVVALSARVPGQVVQVLVLENQTVKKGQVILQLDESDYLSRLEQAQADYAAAEAQANAADAQVQVAEAAATGGYSSAEAQVSGSTAAVTSTKAETAAARAAVLRAKADMNKASLDYQRAKQLLGSNAIPRQQLDAAQAAYESTKAAYAEAQARLKAAEDSQRVAEERVREAQGRLGVSRPVQAQIEAAQANAKLAHAKAASEAAKLETAKLQYGYTKVFAPADGVVSSLAVHPGSYVQPGQSFAQLVPDATYVVANFKETQLDKMRVGQRATVSVDAYPGHTLEGRVESFSGGTGARFALLPPENATGNFVKIVQRVPVRIAWVDLPKDLPPLRAGLSVNVTVHENEQAKAPPPQPAAQPGPNLGRRP